MHLNRSDKEIETLRARGACVHCATGGPEGRRFVVALCWEESERTFRCVYCGERQEVVINGGGKRMKRKRTVLQKVAGVGLFLLVAGGLQGCFGAIDAISGAKNAYYAGRAGVAGYEGATMAKEMSGVTAAFAGYDLIRVAAEVTPANKDQEAAIKAAFEREIARAAREYAASLERRVTVCSDDCPSDGKLMVVHFREEARSGRVVRVLAGDRLKGSMTLVDREKSAPVSVVNVTGEDYAGLVAMINRSILQSFLKEKEGDPKFKEYGKRLNAIPFVSQEGMAVLATR